jgi:peptidoglycan/xylan/chitin deacetylase (PgdA/CDA1 family)
MSERHIGRRELLALAGLAALTTGCSGSESPATAQRTTAGNGATATKGSGTTSALPSPARTLLTTDGADVAHGSRTVPTVALTFHGAGSADVTRAVLAELASSGVHVTVFAVGSWLVAEPTLASAILDGGHELGNHTYSHLPMRQLSATKAKDEVARCAAVLDRLIGTRGPWFRPSGTQTSTPTIRSAARAAGYPRCISYDVDSLDWTDPGPAKVVRTVLTKAGQGSIISLHLGHPGTVQALPAVLDGLARRSLVPVTVTGLLG